MIPRPSCGKWRQIGIPYETCIDFWSLWSPPLGGGSFFKTHLWWTTKITSQNMDDPDDPWFTPQKSNMEPAKITLLKRNYSRFIFQTLFFGGFHMLAAKSGFIALGNPRPSGPVHHRPPSTSCPFSGSFSTPLLGQLLWLLGITWRVESCRTKTSENNESVVSGYLDR